MPCIATGSGPGTSPDPRSTTAWASPHRCPRQVTIAVNRATQTRDFGTIRVKLLSRRAPISDATVPLLEILDVLRDARKVPDANVADVIGAMTKRLTELTPAEG